ncbi:MAG: hypothetical protein ACJ8H8_28235, partial [Geminicoccaceae bacterium]
RPAARAATVDLAALLAERSGSPSGFASLGAEIGLFSPLPPTVLPGGLAASLDAVVTAGRQLILAGSLDDPAGIVASFRLRRLGAPLAEYPRADWITGPAGEGSGGQAFVAAATMPAGTGNQHAPWHTVLVLRSGAELPLDEVPAAAVADPLPHLLAAAGHLAEVPAALELIEPAVRQLAIDQAVRRRIAAIQLLGPPLLRPRASLALPFRCAADVERVMAMLGAEREGRSVELVLVALQSDGSALVEAAALAAGHARSIRLVLPDGNLTRAAVPHLALEATETPIIVMLGSGVVPRVRGWLDTLLEAVEAGPSAALGGELALAGLQLSGMGGSGPLPSLDVAAALRRDALVRVGGLPIGWLDPEHRDADLTLQLLAAGYRARVLAAPCCVRFAEIEPPWAEPAARLATALDTRRLAARAASYRRAIPATAGPLDPDCPLAIAI